MNAPAFDWSCDVCGKPGGVSHKMPAGWKIGPSETPHVCDECAEKTVAELCTIIAEKRKSKKSKKAVDEPHT